MGERGRHGKAGGREGQEKKNKRFRVDDAWMCAIRGFHNPKHLSLEFCLSEADDGGALPSFLPSSLQRSKLCLCLSEFFCPYLECFVSSVICWESFVISCSCLWERGGPSRKKRTFEQEVQTVSGAQIISLFSQMRKLMWRSNRCEIRLFCLVFCNLVTIYGPFLPAVGPFRVKGVVISFSSLVHCHNLSMIPVQHCCTRTKP